MAISPLAFWTILSISKSSISVIAIAPVPELVKDNEATCVSIAPNSPLSPIPPTALIVTDLELASISTLPSPPSIIAAPLSIVIALSPPS